MVDAIDRSVSLEDFKSMPSISLLPSLLTLPRSDGSPLVIEVCQWKVSNQQVE